MSKCIAHTYTGRVVQKGGTGMRHRIFWIPETTIPYYMRNDGVIIAQWRRCNVRYVSTTDVFFFFYYYISVKQRARVTKYIIRTAIKKKKKRNKQRLRRLGTTGVGGWITKIPYYGIFAIHALYIILSVRRRRIIRRRKGAAATVLL